jgi:hypothetical protein
MSVYKARFGISLVHLDKLLSDYQAINGSVNFLTAAGLCQDTSEIIGKQNEIMFFIGFAAGLGNHSLQHVNKV